MQSTKIHFEKLTLAALDAVIEFVRDQARRCVRYGGSGLSEKAGAAALRDLNESLLRPIRAQVEQLAALGASQVQPSPIEALQMTEDESQPNRKFLECGACNRFARRNAEGRCCACGSAKVEKPEPEKAFDGEDQS